MRVTKLIKGYIEEKVREKVYARYKDEETEAKRQREILAKIQSTAEEAAIKIYVDTIRKLSAEYSFIEVAKDIEEQVIVNGSYCASKIKNRNCINSVHQWKTRANSEVEKESKRIMVECELSGSKIDLDKLIENV